MSEIPRVTRMPRNIVLEGKVMFVVQGNHLNGAERETAMSAIVKEHE